MRTVRKRVLPLEPEVIVPWPRGSWLTAAAEQDGQLCIWYCCDTGAERAYKTFRITGTGEEVPEGTSGPWTVPMSDGSAWHVWESAEWVREEL